MGRVIRQEVLDSIIARLADLHSLEDSQVVVTRPAKASAIDALAQIKNVTYALKYTSQSTTTSILSAMDALARHEDEEGKEEVPLIVTSFMGKTGASRLLEAGISWFDLSGNAHIWGPLFFIHIEGKPNRSKKPGPVPSAFSPKASRIARCLLAKYPVYLSQRDISALVGVDPGYVSKIVARLNLGNLLQRNDSGQIRARDPDLLLDAWQEVYRFSKHRIVRAHFPARSSKDLITKVAKILKEECGVFPVATGLAGAWLLDGFADFRTTTFYLPEPLPPGGLKNTGIRLEDRGANLWLVQPKDQGVFFESSMVGSISVAHPVQVYLDLSGHPERSKEAAQSLRQKLLRWKKEA